MLTDNIFKNDADAGQVDIIGLSNPLSLTSFVEVCFLQSTQVEYKRRWTRLTRSTLRVMLTIQQKNNRENQGIIIVKGAYKS